MTTQWSVSPRSELALRHRPHACRQVCSTTLITLAPPCSAALAAGRLARRRTIRLNKSALSHSDRLGGALCAWPGPASFLGPSLLLVWLRPSCLPSSDLFLHLPPGLPEQGFDFLCNHLLPVIPEEFQRVELNTRAPLRSAPSTRLTL